MIYHRHSTILSLSSDWDMCQASILSIVNRFSLAIGHYSAMLWHNTIKVGCGLTEYRDGKWFAKLYTCDYGPAGNYINGQMHKVGKGCSKCPKGTSCSQEYPGLCGKNLGILMYAFVYTINMYTDFNYLLNITGRNIALKVYFHSNVFQFVR